MITPITHNLEPEIKTIPHNQPTSQATSLGLGSRIHARFAAFGGVDLDIPPRANTFIVEKFDSYS